MTPSVGLVNKYWGRDRGGIEAVLHAQACDLSQRGYQVRVLACRPHASPARPFPPGVEGRELRAPVVASMPIHPGFGAALAQLAAASQVLHFHLPFPLAEAAALRLPKRGPWVATMHAEVVNHPAWMRRVQRAITARFLRRVDLILVSSPASSHCGTLAEFQTRVRVLPFGFDLDRFFAAGGVRRPPRPPVLVFLGRLVRYKGLDVLLHALRDLPAELHILGEGRERAALEQLTAELGLKARVRFLGHIPEADLPARLAAADIFVLPSRSPAEMFGVAQVEAMATGLPVVNTALATGTDWVSPHGLTGLTVPPENPAALAAALRLLIEDRNLRLACGRRARTRARALFGIAERGAELAAAYAELSAGSPFTAPGPVPPARAELLPRARRA